MSMNMCIVMIMNIYISKDNEEFLKNIKGEQSMSGLINHLLNDYREDKAYDLFPLRPHESKPAVRLTDKPIIIKTPKEATMSVPIAPGMKPCKHGSSPEFCRFAKPGKPCK